MDLGCYASTSREAELAMDLESFFGMLGMPPVCSLPKKYGRCFFGLEKLP